MRYKYNSSSQIRLRGLFYAKIGRPCLAFRFCALETGITTPISEEDLSMKATPISGFG